METLCYLGLNAVLLPNLLNDFLSIGRAPIINPVELARIQTASVESNEPEYHSNIPSCACNSCAEGMSYTSVPASDNDTLF